MDFISVESWLVLPTLDPVAVVSIAVAGVVVVDVSTADVPMDGVLLDNVSVVDILMLAVSAYEES